MQWNRRNMKMDKSIQKALKNNAKTYEKQQKGSKGILGKLFGKKKQ